MKIIRHVEETEVFNEWKRIAKIKEIPSWLNMNGTYPDNVRWYLCEIEHKDLRKIYIISSDDWKLLSALTFRLLDVVRTMKGAIISENHIVDIREKQKVLDKLEFKFVYVTNSMKGCPFTIIEGNRRSVALQDLNKLVGNQIYLGVSDGFRNFLWARYTYLT